MKHQFWLLCVGVFSMLAVSAQTLEKAQELAYHEKYDSAAATLQSIIDKHNDNLAAWYLLCRIYIMQNKIAETNRLLDQAPKPIRESHILQAVAAHLLYKQNRLEEASTRFNDLLKRTKMKNSTVLAEIACAYCGQQNSNPQYAVTLLERAIKKDKNNPALYVQLGDAYRMLYDGSNAYKSYKAALNIDNTYAMANYKIGKIYTAQKNPQLYLPAFMKATVSDPMFAPAFYELYYHYYFRDKNKAKQYLDKYIAASEYSIKNEYLLTDMEFTLGHHAEAIKMAAALLLKDNISPQPRLYKLIGYCYKELNQLQKALSYFNIYFDHKTDSAYLEKDFETAAQIYSSIEGKEDSAAGFYIKAAALQTDSHKKAIYFKKISLLYKKMKDYANEAMWRKKYYNSAANPNNVDLFHWGLACYLSNNYRKADSVFGMYSQKYPKEEYGYYWRARANAALDTSMTEGLAVPHYLSLITLVNADTSIQFTKRFVIEAYGYLAAYMANTEKDYKAALGYFEKLLELDPNNSDAQKYIAILKKSLAKKDANDSE